MPAGNNNFVDTDAKIKDFLNAVLSSEGIVVDIRRTFINYNGVNRSRVFARRANEMASKGGNEKFVVIALMCYPALQWILQAQDIDRLVEELREQNPDESVSRMSNIQRVLESSLGGCKPQLRLEMRKVFFARCQQLVDAVDEAMNAQCSITLRARQVKSALLWRCCVALSWRLTLLLPLLFAHTSIPLSRMLRRWQGTPSSL